MQGVGDVSAFGIASPGPNIFGKSGLADKRQRDEG